MTSPVFNWRQETVRYHPHIKYVGFKNLKYLGSVPSGSNLKSGPTYERYLSKFSKLIGQLQYEKLLHIAGDKYYTSIPTKENVEFTIDSFENRPPVNFDDIYHKKAFNFLNAQYGTCCREPISNNEEIISYLDLKKSPGYPGNLRGFKNKGELLQNKDFQQFLFNNEHLNTLPFYCVHPKKEFKELEDLKNNKIRLFTIPDLPLCYEQLRFGKKISEALLNYKWSAYGFNPYNGGVNRLAQKLLSKPIRFYYDISGWDKFLPILEDLYKKYIYPNSSIPDTYKDNFLWMAINTYSYIFKTPQGYVFKKEYGNPSGSGTTTRDNIFCHIVIMASALIESYFLKYGSYPAISFVAEQIIQLFGDDSVCAVDLEFELIMEGDFLSKHFAKYGMKMKYLHGGLNYDIEMMQFLGFTFKKYNHNSYLPLYDIQKLATAIIYQNENDSREAFSSRLFILMIMAFPDENFKHFRNAYKIWCKHLTKCSSLTTSEKAYLDMDIITDRDIENMFLGRESCQSPLLDFFKGSLGMEDGDKNVIWNC